MQQAAQSIPVSQKTPWAGYLLSGLAVLFLLFDGVTKVMNVPAVAETQAYLGYDPDLSPAIGLLLLACLALYVIPRTAVLGVILLTGFLGGAVASQVRIGAPVFSLIFPLLTGLLLWGGLYLRDERLRALVPLRS